MTLTEAADACGVSRSTIKRRLGEFGHAYQDAAGSWRVPVSDLLGAGLKLRPRPVTEATESVTQGHDPGQNGAELDQVRAEVQRLAIDLAHERAARQVAEARAAAYAENLADLRHAVRAITGPPVAPEAPPVPTAAPQPPAAYEPQQAAPEPPLRVSRRRWPWSRGS